MSYEDVALFLDLETVIPLLGIDRENQVLSLGEKLRSPDIETGIRKGTEILAIYSRFVKQTGSD